MLYYMYIINATRIPTTFALTVHAAKWLSLSFPIYKLFWKFISYA